MNTDLLKQSVILGRAVECDIVIASKNISRENTRISHEGHHWFVEDLGSTNGTYLNGERIITPVKLHDGDCLRVGDVAFIFHDPDTTTRDNPVPDLEVDPAAGVVRVNRKPSAFLPRNISSCHIYMNAAVRFVQRRTSDMRFGLNTRQPVSLITRLKTWFAV